MARQWFLQNVNGVALAVCFTLIYVICLAHVTSLVSVPDQRCLLIPPVCKECLYSQNIFCTWHKCWCYMTSDWLSRLQVVPGLFLELLPLLLLLLWLLWLLSDCLWVLLLLQLHALLQAAGSPHAALQPAVTTSSTLSRHGPQFGCSQVTCQQKIHNKKKKTKRGKNK